MQPPGFAPEGKKATPEQHQESLSQLLENKLFFDYIISLKNDGN